MLNLIRFLGLFVLLLGIALIGAGVYLALWECLIGGIIGIIDQCKAPTTDSQTVAISIAKIILCEIPFLVGLFAGGLLAKLGASALLQKEL